MRHDASIVLAVPILACTSIDDMIAFYVDRLGFEREWVWGDPPQDGGVRRGEVQLYVMRNESRAGGGAGREVMLVVEDVDSLHAEHVRRGAPIVEPLRDEPWGLREYSVVRYPTVVLTERKVNFESGARSDGAMSRRPRVWSELNRPLTNCLFGT